METYTLKHPITWNEKEISSIDIARPKGKHIKKIGASATLESVMSIAVHVTEYTPRFFDELDAQDYIGVSEVIGNFLGDGQ